MGEAVARRDFYSQSKIESRNVRRSESSPASHFDLKDSMKRSLVLSFCAYLTALLASLAAEEPPVRQLITRDRVQLNLAGAEKVLSAAKEKATAMGLKMNVAIVDDGGHLLAFARMDGARPASASTAITKAITAATFRQETGPLPARGEPDLLLNLSLKNAALAGGGKITTLKGGVPIVVDGQIIGGIGVGGGSGEQDAEVAKAGVDALLESLQKNGSPITR
jgi:glc operon protein GlcG